MSHVILLVVGVVVGGGKSDPAALDLARLWPTFEAGTEVQGALWCMAFGMLGSSFVLPRLMLQHARSSASAAGVSMYTPFILSMALAESSSVMSLVAADFVGEVVPELMLIPVGAAVAVSLARFPQASAWK